MTENDDLLIKNFFDEYGVGDIPDDGFSRRVRKVLPRRHRDWEWLWLSMAVIAVAVCVVAWFVSGAWLDVYANFYAAIRCRMETLNAGTVSIWKAVVGFVALLWLFYGSLFQRQKYSIEG